MALDCPALSFVCWQTTNRNVKCQQVQLGYQLLLGNVWKQLGWVFALGGLQTEYWYMTSWFATMCPLQLIFWKFKDLSNHFLLLVLDQSDLLICDKVPPPTFWTILRIICFCFFTNLFDNFCWSKGPPDMWRSALRLPHCLLLLVAFNPHRVFSEPDIILCMSFSRNQQQQQQQQQHEQQQQGKERTWEQCPVQR